MGDVKYRGTPHSFIRGGSAPRSDYSPCPSINHFKDTVLTSKPYNYLTTLHPFNSWMKLMNDITGKQFATHVCSKY